LPADIQHEIAEQLLHLIEKTGVAGKLTYQGAAKLLKRPNPQDDGRAFGSICDLLDAAACLAGVPALALFAVKNADGKINPRAWRQSPEKRRAILMRSEHHTFTAEDFVRIHQSLHRLYPLGNKKAWSYLEQVFDGDQLERRLLGDVGIPALDALNDYDSEPAVRSATTGYIYVRNQALRGQVISRANGVCEYCGREGFLQEGGGKYLEAHHVIHLKNQGPDSLTNLIALCANDHREVHFGTLKRQKQMDTRMLEIIAGLNLDRRPTQ
jgi:hypothetical protein